MEHRDIASIRSVRISARGLIIDYENEGYRHVSRAISPALVEESVREPDEEGGEGGSWSFFSNVRRSFSLDPARPIARMQLIECVFERARS